MLSDSSFLQHLRQRGPRFVDQQFGLNEMIDRTLRLYGVKNESAPSPYPHRHSPASHSHTEVQT